MILFGVLCFYFLFSKRVQLPRPFHDERIKKIFFFHSLLKHSKLFLYNSIVYTFRIWGDRYIEIGRLRGKVVLIFFWGERRRRREGGGGGGGGC